MMLLGLKFLLAHFLGDFLFQPTKWVIDKRKYGIRSIYLYLHLLIHFVLLVLVTAFNPSYWLGIIIITVSHYFIDALKCYLLRMKREKLLFFVDQFLHIAVIFAMVWFYHPYTITFDWLFTVPTLALLTVIVFLTFVTPVILKLLLTTWSADYDTTYKTNHAGKYIGILERLFIFLFVVINFWPGIGFLLAAKSIFRFGDLKERQDLNFTEYVLIGTLLSFGFGIGTALLYQVLLGSI